MTKDTNESQNQVGLDFSGLVLGFSSAALYYLGESDLDQKSKPAINLPLARQNIDILLLLREKTVNNLTDDESKLLNQVITDLQSKFVATTKPGA